METFTRYLLLYFGQGYERKTIYGLTEAKCRAKAELIGPRDGHAYCVNSSRPIQTCPFAPPCYWMICLDDARTQEGLVEPFTLIIWLWMGMRFKATQIENLGPG
jgi:hypothetical protein